MFFPPDSQEDSESTLSSSPCSNFSETLPSFSNCKDISYLIYILFNPKILSCHQYPLCLPTRRCMTPIRFGEIPGHTPHLSQGCLQAAFKPIELNSEHFPKCCQEPLMSYTEIMRNRPAAGKRVAGVEIKHIWLPGESESNKRLFWHHLGQSQDLQPLWSGVRMLSKEVSVDTCLTISIKIIFDLFEVSQRGTLDAEISTECLLPGARLRCRALKEGNSVGWPRYTWTVHIQNGPCALMKD